MRRRKGRSIYSFQMIRPNAINMNSITVANTIIWTSVVSLCCLLTYVSCDDAAFNSKLSTFSGHVKSTTPMQPDLFTNHTAHIVDDQLLRNQSSSSSSQQKQTGRTFVRSGNELWDGLVNDCLHKPSFSCFQKNIYTYLDDTLRLADVNVTDRIKFKKIDIDPKVLAQLQNNTDDDNEVNDSETREFKSGSKLIISIFLIFNCRSLVNVHFVFEMFLESPIEEVTDALYGKWRNFMMTHDLEMKMPEILFDGATFRVTPRGFDGDGALIKLEVIPKALEEVQPEARLFGLKKKISKTFHFLKSKCTHSPTTKIRPGELAHSEKCSYVWKEKLAHIKCTNAHVQWTQLVYRRIVEHSAISRMIRNIPT